MESWGDGNEKLVSLTSYKGNRVKAVQGRQISPDKCRSIFRRSTSVNRDIRNDVREEVDMLTLRKKKRDGRKEIIKMMLKPAASSVFRPPVTTFLTSRSSVAVWCPSGSCSTWTKTTKVRRRHPIPSSRRSLAAAGRDRSTSVVVGGGPGRRRRPCSPWRPERP